MEGKNQWTPEMKAFKRKLENAVRESGGASQHYYSNNIYQEGKFVKKEIRAICGFKRIKDCRVFDNRTELLLRNGKEIRIGEPIRFNRGEYLFSGTSSCGGYRVYSPNLDYQFTYVGYDGSRRGGSFTDSDGCYRDAPGWGGHSAG